MPLGERAGGRPNSLLTVDAEIVVGYGRCAIGIDRKMQGRMHEKIIPWTLSNNSEVVYERIVRLTVLKRIFKALLRNPSRLILITRSVACTANTLWLKMHFATDVVSIDGERDQSVQRTAKIHRLSDTAVSARNENGEIDVRSIVDLYRCL
jgi:hypothetical protein